MDCRQVLCHGILEEYLAGRLSEAEARAFERHYFGCERCRTALELALEIREAFGPEAVKAGAGIPGHEGPGPEPSGPKIDGEPPEAKKIGRDGTTRRAWPKVALAAAATLALAAVGLGLLELAVDGGAREARLRALGELQDVPAYVPLNLRGSRAASGDRTFREGMEAYLRGDYADAVPLLETSVQLGSDKPVRHFYLGVSRLAIGRAGAAIGPLSVAAARPEFAGQAGWLLAKAHLRRGDREAALRALAEVIAGGGERAADARELRRRIEALR